MYMATEMNSHACHCEPEGRSNLAAQPRPTGIASPFGLAMTVLLLLVATATGFGSGRTLEEIRMAKRWGIGLSAGGPLGVMGIEMDVNLNEQFSLSGGLGTGLDFSSFMVKGRYFLLGEWVSPYFATGVARWWTNGLSQPTVSPSVLANKFLGPGYDLSRGFSVWIVHPGVGVQFMHPVGFSFFAEVQYLFKLFDFANGTYAGVGMHWYF